MQAMGAVLSPMSCVAAYAKRSMSTWRKSQTLLARDSLGMFGAWPASFTHAQPHRRRDYSVS